MATRNTDKHVRGIAEYDSKREDWSSYVEKIELFFIANDRTAKAKKKPMLLSCCRIASYRIFKRLAAPAKSADKTLSELVSLIKNHQNPKRNPIAERFLFNSRNRKPNKNIPNYMAELCRLSQYCSMEIPWKK